MGLDSWIYAIEKQDSIADFYKKIYEDKEWMDENSTEIEYYRENKILQDIMKKIYIDQLKNTKDIPKYFHETTFNCVPVYLEEKEVKTAIKMYKDIASSNMDNPEILHKYADFLELFEDFNFKEYACIYDSWF